MLQKKSPPFELTPAYITPIFQYGSERERNALILQIKAAFNFLVVMAIKVYQDEPVARTALDEAILALERNVVSGRLQEGNIRGYFKTIFWRKHSDLLSLFRHKKNQSPIDIDDFWLLPIPDSDPVHLFEQGYKLVLDWFDQQPTCQRDHCRELCSLKIETDWNTNEILAYLDEQNVLWDDNTYEFPNSPQSLALRNQRLRDRIAHCWQRLRTAISNENISKQHILSLLKK